MVRVVVKTAKGPKEIKPQKNSIFICMCGLSKNQPSCDGSHKKTLDEKDGEIYVYDPVTGERSVEHLEDEEMCCGGGMCGCGHNEEKKGKLTN